MTKDIHFGTDGIRGEVGKEPFTSNSLINLGKAIAAWGSQKRNRNAKFLIINDTRISCQNIKKFLEKGLKTIGAQYIDGGILPTPACLAIIKTSRDFDFGIVISASHNKFSDNGIKIFDKTSFKLNEPDEKLIEKLFKQFATAENSNSVENNILNGAEFTPYTHHEFKELYKKNLLSYFKPNLLANIKITLDCANGATYEVAPEIFETLGAEITCIAKNPIGTNINKNCGALHLEQLQEAVIQNKSDFGFAFDGDGDRVMAVNKYGEIKNGDDILAILSTHPDINIKKVVGTIMTNHGFLAFLQENNKELIRTPVGDKYVMAKIEEENLELGGEASGHIIIKNYLSTGDGIFASLKMLEAALINKNLELKSFEKYPQVLLNVPIKAKHNLSEGIFAQIINEYKQKIINGRLIVRYSGTENLLRIMTEDKSAEFAHSIANQLAEDLQKVLN